jgi:hypothetical protein
MEGGDDPDHGEAIIMQLLQGIEERLQLGLIGVADAIPPLLRPLGHH